MVEEAGEPVSCMLGAVEAACGRRQLSWRVGDNYLGRLRTVTGRVREAGSVREFPLVAVRKFYSAGIQVLLWNCPSAMCPFYFNDLEFFGVTPDKMKYNLVPCDCSQECLGKWSGFINDSIGKIILPAGNLNC